jgi:hypothetical protein
MTVTVIGPIHSSFRSFVYVRWVCFQRLLRIRGAFQMFAPNQQPNEKTGSS